MDLTAFTGLDTPWLILVGLVVVAATIVQFGLGMGFGLTAAPLLALIDPELVPAPVLFLGMLTSGWGAWGERTAIQWGEVGVGTIGRTAGVLAAAALLSVLADRRSFMLAFGLMIGLAVLLSAFGRRIAFSRVRLLAMSMLSGIMGTITSVGAPPLALVYEDRPAATARPTLAAFFAIGCVISLVALYASGFAGPRDAVLAALMVPPMVLGLAIARGLRGRFDRRYRPALLVVAGLAAIMLIVRGVS